MHRLGQMTTEEAARITSGVLVPLGATEQHGPHLPLDTDSQIAVAWADAVADRLDGWVVAPLLPVGSSGEHQSFAGTLSIGGEVLRNLVVELVRSAGQSFEQIVLLSGHGGNFGSVTEAVDQMIVEGHNVRSLFTQWPAEVDIDAHAGCTETSIMLHLAPEAVRSPLIATGETAPVGELMTQLRAHGIGAVVRSGVLGDPTLASADLGRRLFDDLVARTVSELG